jgi:predicted RNA-binding protein with PIN domain
MPILVDGHNLIAKLPDIHLDDPDDEERLVERLRRYQAHSGKRVTVFFDAGLPGGPDRNLSTSKVRVVFAPAGGSADRLIVRRVRRSRDPGGLTVVTSDEKIIAAVERGGARAVHSEIFAADLDALSAAVDAMDPSRDVHLSPAEVKEWLALFEEPPAKADT